MAEFNAKLDATAGPSNFLSYSGGVQAAPARQYAKQPEKTSTVGSLFDEAVGVLTGAVGAVDTIMKEKIKDTAQEQVDLVQAEFGASDVSLIEGSDVNNEPPPDEIARSEKNLKRLSLARQQGKISENSYAARLDSVARQLRSRYPGHRDYIDSTISSITGIKPANEIIRNLDQEAQRLQARNNTEANRKVQYIEEMAKAGIMLPPQAEAMSHLELIKYSAPFFKQKQDIAARKAQLEAGELENTVQTRLMTETVQKEVSLDQQQLIAGVFNGIGKSYKEQSEKLNQFLNDPSSLKGEDIAALGTQFAQMRMQFLKNTNEKLIRDYPTLTQKQREEVVSGPLSVFNVMEQAIKDKDIGALNAIHNRLEASKTSDDLEFYKDAPELRVIGSVKRLFGEDSAMFMTNAMSAQVDARNKALLAKVHSNMFSTEGGRTSLKLEMEGALKKGVTDPRFRQGIFTPVIDTFLSDKTTPDGIKKSADLLFGDLNNGFIASLPQADRVPVYRRLTSPEVFAKVKSLKDKGDTKVYDNYVTWTTDAFGSLFTSNIEALRSVRINSQLKDVVFNDQTLQFNIIENPISQRITNVDPLSTTMNVVDSAYTAGISSKIMALNAATGALVPILKDKGIDPKTYMLKQFEAMGFTQDLSKKSDFVATVQNTAAGALFSLVGAFNPPSKLGGPTGPVLKSDTKTGQGVKTFPPGVEGQMTPLEGDNLQIQELSDMIERKKQDIILMDQLSKETNDPEAIDRLDKLLGEVSELMAERQSIQDSWVNQFRGEKRTRKDKEPMNTPKMRPTS